MFNRKILDKYLSAFTSETVADYDNRHKDMIRWKTAIESGDLLKTKEKTIQGKFLVEVFERVLGYATIGNNSEYNQEAEYKSELDGSQADCTLGFFTSETKTVRAAIELKDANTDLDKKQYRSSHLTPVEQAFGYAHKNGSGCGWVIVSNFVEIRLYKSSSSLEYEKFLITELNDEAEFKRFYFLLCKEHLIEKSGKSLVDRIYDDNEQAKVEISNAFYGDYKKLRAELFQSLQKHNAAIDDITLFSKSQKILDRFIFVCFCENRLLLPKGIFKAAINAAKSSFDMTPNRVWRELRGMFHSIDRGNPPMKINGYNGGLFEKDDVLDNLAIPDVVLERFAKLTEYDFDSDLNVNILGHIFEQSISDLEQFKAELAGMPFDRQSSKQKADGIFYTPDYVTKFVVEKTVGRWLDDEKDKIKRELIGLNGYVTTVGRKKITLKKWEEIPEISENNADHDAILKLHIVFWEKYAERLKSIRVLDPACGSGAFLNQAFDYLCDEGNYAVEMRTSLSEGQASLFDWDTHILQNNLFGVDLNTESVEITKLSLWLKTARSGSELVSIDANIKCGNSIISSNEVAGELAFDWIAGFPAVIGQGGFDVVIGNPPYGATLSQAEKDYLTAHYETTEYNFDTYKTFMELGLKLTKQDGYMGYITPNTFFFLEKGANKLRKFLFEGYTLLDIVELFNVFPSAVVEPAITIFKNKRPSECDKLEVISVPRKTDLASTFISDGVRNVFEQKDLREKEGYIFNFKETDAEKQIIDKINKIAKPLSDYFGITRGVDVYEVGKGIPPQTKEIQQERPYEGNAKIDNSWLAYTRGRAINRYTDAWDGEYIKYGEWLANPKNPEMFKNEKLFLRETADYPVATYDASGKICKKTVYCIYHLPENTDDTDVSLKYALGLINSKLMKWIFQHEHFQMVGKPFAKILSVYAKQFPIVVADDQSAVISLVDGLLENCQARFDKAKQFTDYLSAIYAPKTITEKLSGFYNLDFKGFVDELKKQNAKLTPKQEMELMPLFQEKAGEIVELSQVIERLDNELDEVVFALYGLTAEERAVIDSL